MMVTERARLLGVLLAALILWPLGCSRAKPAAQKPLIPPAATPPTLEKAPASLPPEAPAHPIRAAPKAKPGPLAHEIKSPHETLFSIARWYTGSGENWVRIAEANSIRNPRRIQIGDTILIPPDLLKTRRPMPVPLSSPPGHKKKGRPLKPDAPPSKNDAIELFGPVQREPQAGGPEKNELPAPLETLD